MNNISFRMVITHNRYELKIKHFWQISNFRQTKRGFIAYISFEQILMTIWHSREKFYGLFHTVVLFVSCFPGYLWYQHVFNNQSDNETKTVRPYIIRIFEIPYFRNEGRTFEAWYFLLYSVNITTEHSTLHYIFLPAGMGWVSWDAVLDIL